MTLAAPIVAMRLAWRRDEPTSARGRIARILARLPAARISTTCNTVTVRDPVRGWALDRIKARLTPLDYLYTLRRFIGAWQPGALILIESELRSRDWSTPTWEELAPTGSCR